MKKTLLLLFVIFLATNINATEKKTFEFHSRDSLKITADLYLINKSNETPFILLCHQAGWSRGEYIETAPKFNKLGFNCMAIDQRSGDIVNEVNNETHKRAVAAKKAIQYSDGEQDILAAIDYIKKTFNPKTLILLGSSYSSALVLKIAGDNPEKIQGVLSYSPGEYFVKYGGKPKTWITDSAKNIECPVFVTSAQNEKAYWSPIFEQIKSENKTSFEPKTKGQHGSRALWSKFEDSKAYWKATTEFLNKYF